MEHLREKQTLLSKGMCKLTKMMQHRQEGMLHLVFSLGLLQSEFIGGLVRHLMQPRKVQCICEQMEVEQVIVSMFAKQGLLPMLAHGLQ